MTSERYAFQRYLLMTLDPVHPGAGGYRLGRVDLSIAREPGTRLPKIPGSSLHGAARAYAAYLYEKPICAGQGQIGSSDHCGNPTCPICYTFGYLKGKAMSSGVVNVFDAHILLFPVHSMLGPVWVSTRQRLHDAAFSVPDGEPAEGDCWTTFDHTDKLNLGWLMLDVKTQPININVPATWQNQQQWQAVQNHIVLVSETLFPHIVNSNLEVRTSVSIDPQTGAAAEKALYTYEAIPRATFLWFDVVEDDYRIDPVTKKSAFPVTDKKAKAEKVNDRVIYHDNQGEPLRKIWQRPLDVFRDGLALAEYLGIGGMGTRGFGRVQIVGDPVVKSEKEIFDCLERKEAQDEPAK